MKISTTKILGNNQIKLYQEFVLICGILSVVISTIIAIVNRDINFLLGTIILILVFTILLILYSKLYNVEYDDKNFYFRNLFKKSEEKNIDFIEIKYIPFIAFAYVICFKNKKYYFMQSSKEYYKNIFKSNKQYVSELTEMIRHEIDLAKKED